MDTEVTRIFANRLQRFIPDRENAEGMADALQEDLEQTGRWIGGPGGIRTIMGKRICAVCREPLGDVVFVTKPRWWEIWKIAETLHPECVHGQSTSGK